MRRTVRSIALVGLTALVAVGLAACEVPLPPAALVVTTTVDGADAVPGDGVCEVTPGTGDCSLRAAVAEGNALGAADITLPAGYYAPTSLSVTGDLAINDGAPVDARLGSTWVTVQPGARLVVDGLSSFDVPGARFAVNGTFVGRHLTLVGLESSGQVVVGPGGSALVDRSILAHVFGVQAPIVNQGTLIARHIALLAWSDIGVDTTAFTNTGRAYVASSVLRRCGGVAPISLGFNSDDDGTCDLAEPSDLPAALPAFNLDLNARPLTYELVATSPLVDAVPIGVNGCGTEVLDDVSGRPAPVDGNGDGIVGCDIGAREVPAAP